MDMTMIKTQTKMIQLIRLQICRAKSKPKISRE